SVVEVVVAEIVVQRVSIAGKVRLDDVEMSVVIVISRGNTHSSLRLAVGTERRPRRNGNIFEVAILEIVEERAGGRIISHIDIGPAVFVEIGCEHTKTVRTRGLRDT